MKKFIKALILTVLSFVMLSGITSGLYAEEWQNPFKDVKSSAWYYDAVKNTVEKGIFTGVSDDRFAPNTKMTRAMFVTTLAKMVDAEITEYTGTPFTDVKADAWYAPYVEWAYENEITNGVSADKFGVNNPISREQMVTLFYNTAKKYGHDVSVNNLYKYLKVSDKSAIETWAQEAVKWALQNSILSGTGTKGTMVIISPDKTATRAEAAQLITKYIEFTQKDMPKVTGFTINGNPIENYTIVYGAEAPYPKGIKKAANSLAEYIKNATGYDLPVVTDAEDPTGYEIIVGITNRESMGIVSADRDGEDIASFEISVQGNNILIAGKSDKKGHDGSRFGVYAFAKELLCVEFYTDDVCVYNVIRTMDIPDGYVFKDGPGYEYRVVYWGGLVSDEMSTGEPQVRAGMMHNMWELIGHGDNRSPDPCLTDEANIETIKANFLKEIEGRPDLEAIWVSQNDTHEHCMCSNCLDVYREEGSRAGTLMRLCNILADVAAENGLPELEIWTLAYHYTAVPVRSVLDEQVVVFYCTINNCASHPYNDPSCSLNRSVYNHLTGWDAACEKLYAWDYSTNFKYSLTPMPLLTAFRENRNWYYELGVRGEFNNAIDSRIGEFDALKAYALSELEWDPTMSEDEYNEKINKFLKAYYGPGWKYIREYIDLTEELSDANCFGYYCAPASVIKDAVVLEYAQRIENMWDAAEALCDNEEQRQHIRISRTSWTFLYLSGSYTARYVNGDAVSRAAYSADVTSFYNEAKGYSLRWAETAGSIVFEDTNPPIEWVS